MIEPIPPRDLADFHLRWQEFRPLMEQVLETGRLTRAQAETLTWLVALSDRISADDIAP